MALDWYSVIVPEGYAALAKVIPPPGFREISRIFENGRLLKVFFEKCPEVMHVSESELGPSPGMIEHVSDCEVP